MALNIHVTAHVIGYCLTFKSLGKSERHVRFDSETDDNVGGENRKEAKSLQDRLLMLAGQAKNDEQVGEQCFGAYVFSALCLGTF